jgi:hypothetical protein
MHRRAPSVMAGAVTLVAVVAGLTAAATPAAATHARSALVVLVTWGAGNGSPAAPPDSMTPAIANARIGGTDSAWFQSVSNGEFGGWAATATGWLSIPPPVMDPGCGNIFRAGVQANGNAAAAALGYDVAAYTTVIYYFSYLWPCVWGGHTYATNVWLNGSMSIRTTLHELGHTLGLDHAKSITCQDPFGIRVPLSGYCGVDDYGDWYSVMGAAFEGSLAANEKAALGWMPGRVAEVPRWGGTYTLQPLEMTSPALTQALRIVDGADTFWLEYRQPLGVDHWLTAANTAGVLVRVQRPGATLLMDMTPTSNLGFADAGLPVGATWTNPGGSARITVNAAGGAGAQVTVTSTRTLVPDVRGRSLAEARQLLQVSGLLVGSVTGLVDHTCNRIGLVMSQSPGAGTEVAEGSAVNVRLGQRPRTPCP